MLVALVILLATLSGLNLFLTFGVIRRLRMHSAMLGEGAAAPTGASEVMMGAGGEPGPFEPVTMTDGSLLERAGLNDLLVGFFSTGCSGCRAQAPVFADTARRLGRDRVLAVVAVGDEAVGAELVAVLEPAARVVTEPDHGPVQRAFAVEGFPALCVLDHDGRIKGTTMGVIGLPALLADPHPV